jgi:hypothetical protein
MASGFPPLSVFRCLMRWMTPHQRNEPMNFEATDLDDAFAHHAVRGKAITTTLERTPRSHARRAATLIPPPTDRRRLHRFKFAHLAKALSCSVIAPLREKDRSVLTHLKNTTNEMERL